MFMRSLLTMKRTTKTATLAVHQSKVQAPARDNRSSIWDRLAVQDVQQREATHVEFLAEREKREMENCSFAPVVDVEREEEEDGDIFDRLYETDIGATDYEATGVDECTFEPDLPVASQQIASYAGDGDVYERLSSCKDRIIKSFLIISFPFYILID